MIELHGQIKPQRLHGRINVVASDGSSGGPLQAKTAYPSHSEQIIAPDEDYYGLVSVTVKPVPQLPACVVSVAEDTANIVETVVNIAAAVSIQIPSGVEYFYNHEQLPEIPADVAENYPYILVIRSLAVTRIYASTEKAYFWTTDEGVNRITIPAGNYVRYTFNSEANALALDSSGTGTYFTVHGDGNWAVWWANYDVPKGSADAEEIYFPASQPQEEQPAEATHFYYNGVRLPAIPADVLTEYPYAWIRKNITSGYYDLALCKTPRYYNSGIYPADTSEWYRIEIANANTATEWIFNQTVTNFFGIDSSRTVMWSNHDIPNGSADAEEIYYYGTVAVPDPE